MPATVEAMAPALPVRRRFTLRRVCFLVGIAVILPVGAESYRVVLGDNFHTVLPGQVYRCSQPSGATLDKLIEAHGIKTVVNLRGGCDPMPWYLDECRSTHRHAVSQFDVNFSAGRYPSVSELRFLIEVLDGCEYPLLLHCRRGADRTGMTAMMVLLLKTDKPLAEARRQLSLRYGHVALGRTASLDELAGFYTDWLGANGKSHSSGTFRDWALNHYCPGTCWGLLGWSEPPPSEARCGKPIVLKVRAANTSLGSWRLSPISTGGLHLGCAIYDEQDRQIDVVKTGMRDGTVHAGQTMNFTLVLPPLHQPGRYRVVIDLVDEAQCWFYQTGAEPLEQELIVRE